jgi:DNA-binding response OmpR family regulator
LDPRTSRTGPVDHAFTKPRILIVEDDDALAGLLLEYLGMHGFELDRVAAGDVGAERILASEPDVVVLDLMLPELSGLEVCRRVRAVFDGAILMLTASQSVADHVVGLELGADDFVVKPIEPRVLLARIRALLRRNDAQRSGGPDTEEGLLRAGPIVVDVSSRDVRVDGTPVSLTTMEFDVLRKLAEEAGSVVRREALYADVMGVEYDGLDRGMDVHVSRIRRKLERSGFDPGRLKSVRGVGYLLTLR